MTEKEAIHTPPKTQPFPASVSLETVSLVRGLCSLSPLQFREPHCSPQNPGFQTQKPGMPDDSGTGPRKDGPCHLSGKGRRQASFGPASLSGSFLVWEVLKYKQKTGPGGVGNSQVSQEVRNYAV